jgi:hypothetical protein
MSKDNLHFEDSAASYRLFNKTTGKSPRTVDWYDARLGLYRRFNGTDARLRAFTIDEVVYRWSLSDSTIATLGLC